MTSGTRITIGLVAVLVVSLLAVRLVSLPGAARAANAAVDWKLPTTATTTVSTGDTVTWTWRDALSHSVTSVSGPSTFDSTVKTGSGTTFAFTFAQAGTYTYRCSVHPSEITGTVVVQATASTPAASPTAVPPTPPVQPGGDTLILNGAEEVPPVASDATGTFKWKLEGNTLTYTLKASGTALTMAHLHFAARGANGPVVVTLFPTSADGVATIDVSGRVTESVLAGPFAGKPSDFLAALRAGNIYVNVHSKANPAGVLRVQLPPPLAPPATGTGTARDAGGSAILPLVLGATVMLLAGGALLASTSRRSRTR